MRRTYRARWTASASSLPGFITFTPSCKPSLLWVSYQLLSINGNSKSDWPNRSEISAYLNDQVYGTSQREIRGRGNAVRARTFSYGRSLISAAPSARCG